MHLVELVMNIHNARERINTTFVHSARYILPVRVGVDAERERADGGDCGLSVDERGVAGCVAACMCCCSKREDAVGADACTRKEGGDRTRKYSNKGSKMRGARTATHISVAASTVSAIRGCIRDMSFRKNPLLAG
jgi:hypothetical protein